MSLGAERFRPFQISYFKVSGYSPIDGKPRRFINLDEEPPETWSRGMVVEEDYGGTVTRVAWQKSGKLDVRKGEPDYYAVYAGITTKVVDHTDERSWFWRWVGRKCGARM